MSLVKYLGNLGYGTRREVTWLVEQRRVTDRNGCMLRSDQRVDHDAIRVDGDPLDPKPGSVLMLHKPVGYVCSTQDTTNPVIYELLPQRFRARSPIMAPIGRLDLETSGLLLVSDDGTLNHRLTSPKSHVPKVYEATLAEPLRDDAIALFASGTLRLASEPDPLRPAQLECLSPTQVRLTLHEGKYHQARRMFAAVGGHVTQLTRVAIGQLPLGAQAVGTWRVLDEDERALVMTSTPRVGPPTTP